MVNTFYQRQQLITYLNLRIIVNRLLLNNNNYQLFFYGTQTCKKLVILLIQCGTQQCTTLLAAVEKYE